MEWPGLGGASKIHQAGGQNGLSVDDEAGERYPGENAVRATGQERVNAGPLLRS